MKEIAEILIIVLYNLTILVGATYMVAVYNWSMWIYALAILLLANQGRSK